MRFRMYLVILIFFVLIGSFELASGANFPKAGTSCKQGQTYSGNGMIFKCIKSGKKYVWDKGTKVSSASNNTNNSSGNNSGNNNSQTVNVGDPCDRETQTAPMVGGTAICAKQGGVLKWKAMSGGNDSGQNNQNNQSNQNNGNSGSQLGMNADGTWRTLPGYPTDVAPPGMNGPAWFSSNWDAYTAEPTFPRCTSTTPLSSPVTDLTTLKNITPQGYMQPGSHALPVAHMYFNTVEATGEKDSKGQAFRSKRVNVYAPADLTLRTYGEAHVKTSTMDYVENFLGFTVCGNYWIALGHMSDINPVLVDAAKNAVKNDCGSAAASQSGQSSDCYATYISFKVKAGTLLGTSSGRSGGFDLAFMDTSQINPNILDPSAFKGKITTAKCVMNYMTESLKSQFMAKLEGDNGCGQVGSDIAGTASGVWLAVGKRDLTVREDFHIALANHWSNKNLLVFSIGEMTDLAGIPAATYTFTPTTSGANKAFKDVKSGEVACYDALTRSGVTTSTPAPTIYIKPTTGSVEKLEIGSGTGKCGSGPFTMPAQTTTFERRNVTG